MKTRYMRNHGLEKKHHSEEALSFIFFPVAITIKCCTITEILLR